MKKDHELSSNASTDIWDRNGFLDIRNLLIGAISNWKVFVASVAISLLVAFLSYSVFPQRWRGTVTIQVGQVPNLAGPGSTAIESNDQFVQRFYLRGFRNAVLQSAGTTKTDAKSRNERDALYGKTLQAVSIRGTSFVRIGLASISVEDVRSLLNSTVAAAIGIHNEMLAPIGKSLDENKRYDSEQLGKLSDEINRQRNVLAGLQNASSSTNLAAIAVQTALLASKEDERNRLELELREIEVDRDVLKLFPTKVIDEVLVDSRPYFPNLKVFLGIGFVVGILLGFGFVSMRL
jgi:hypothetical protein